MFRFLNISYHKVITMFSDSNLNINRFMNYYDSYIQHIYSLSYIKSLDIEEFTKLFKSLWCVMSFKFNKKLLSSKSYKKYYNFINTPLKDIICRKCLFKLPDIKNLLTHI